MITWDEPKRISNLVDHGIDLAECATIFDYPMVTEDDATEAYGEQRLFSLGWLHARVVALVWTDRAQGAHLISCRYANRNQIRSYKKAIFG
jgi:uncharacterized protein